MSKPKDYTSNAFVITITVVILMLLLYLIPPQHFGEFALKRINIFSDILNLHPDSLPMLSDELVTDSSVVVENMSSTTSASIDSALCSRPTLTTQNWNISDSKLTIDTSDAQQQTSNLSEKDILSNGGHIVSIENFAPKDDDRLQRFHAQFARKDRGRPIRIAFLGDSFIEGDILTADIREQLQLLYGGHGVGFVPMASEVLKFRGTVKHASSGWNVVNLLHRKSAPADLKDKFSISGMLCVPSEGAFSRFEGVKLRKNIRRFSTARLLFINEQTSVINMTINDSIKNVFTPESSSNIQQISVSGNISSVKVSINNTDGFIGYGMMLEDTNGISVDNYSLRGNSGLSLVATNSSINSQIDNAIGFDLIVLQYGLNAMSPNVSSYGTYSRQMSKVINYIKGCFPTSAIVVMSVGDRSSQIEGEFVTMPTVHAMLKAQREAAQKCGVAFWSTYDAMGGQGSMVQFVKRNWAAKDYTHIGYAGGKHIAKQFVRALISDKEATFAQEGSATAPSGVPHYQKVLASKVIE